MPRPRTGRPRVEDCVALRVVDIIRPDGTLGPAAFGSADLRDPATGDLVGSVSWRAELLAWAAWVYVKHRRSGQTWDAISYRLDLEPVPGAIGLHWRLFCGLTGEPCRGLFLPNLETRFGSREAHGLAYDSQGKSPARRAEARAKRIRVELGGSSDLAAPFPPRPKGMWAQTYARHRQEATAAEAAAGR